MPKFAISCTIVQLDDDGDVLDGGYEGNIDFELDTQSPPTVVLREILHGQNGVSGICG